MDSQTTPKRNTEAARRASLKTFARRRAARAKAELESQGWTVIPPQQEREGRADDDAR